MKNANTYENKRVSRLLNEFKEIDKHKNIPVKIVEAIVILTADETDLSGENGERFFIGLNIIHKLKNNITVILLGTKKHNDNFKINYVRKFNKYKFVLLANDTVETTQTQIEKLSKYIQKCKIQNILIVSHAYHIPRIKRYCHKYFENSQIQINYWIIGIISDQQSQVREEISKIIEYSKKGDLPLFI